MIDLNDFYQSSADIYLQERKEKKEIRFLGTVAGLCVIGYVIIQNLLSDFLYATPLAKYYETDPAFSSVVTIFFSILGMLIPFGIGGYFIGRRTRANVFNFEKPVSIPLMLSAVPFGFFICLIGNYATSLFVTFMDEAGIYLSAPDYPIPTDLSGRIVYAVSIAVVPALVEEFAIRGAVLQPLRKYGQICNFCLRTDFCGASRQSDSGSVCSHCGHRHRLCCLHHKQRMDRCADSFLQQPLFGFDRIYG